MFSTTSSQSACIICSKLTSEFNPDSDCVRTEPERLKRFFNLLERYLDHQHKLDKEEARDVFPIEELINAGLISCAECSKVVESFCQLYHQMKVIELLLDGKVRTLKNIMLGAQRLPTRIKRFRENVEQLAIDVSADEIIDFKGDLVKKCTQKLRVSFPLLRIKRWKPQPMSTVSKKNNNSLTFNRVTNTKALAPMDMKVFGEAFEPTSTCAPQNTVAGYSECESQTPAQTSDPNAYGDNASSVTQIECDICRLQVGDLSTHLYTVHFESSDQVVYQPEPSPPKDIAVPVIESIEMKGESCSDDLLHEIIPAPSIPPDTDEGPVIGSLPVQVLPSSSFPVVFGSNNSRYTRDPVTGKRRCSLCPREFDSYISFKSHFNMMHEVTRYKCSFSNCDRKFTTKANLTHHAEVAHLGVRFQCAFCLRTFSNRNGRSQHMRKTCPLRNNRETGSD